MNTHSREADCRIELLTAFAFKCGVEPEYIKLIMDSLTTEEALAALKESGRLYEVMDYAMERICFYLDKRAKGRLEIDCIMYSNEFGELAKAERQKNGLLCWRRNRRSRFNNSTRNASFTKGRCDNLCGLAC